MKSVARRAARSFASLLPLSVYRWLVRREVVAFLYHVVSENDLPHIKHLYPYKTPGQFRSDLRYLKRRFNVISYDDLVSSRGLPPRAAMVTFDDGFAECHSVVRPILLEEGVPCTFFVTTGFLDNRTMFYRNKCSLCVERVLNLPEKRASRLLRWIGERHGTDFQDRTDFVRWARTLEIHQESVLDDLCAMLEVDTTDFLREHRPYLTSDQVRELVSGGFSIGAHTLRHPRLDLLGPAEVEDEMIGSCRAVMNLTARQRVGFAFPYSSDGMDRGLLSRLVREHGFIQRVFDTRGVYEDEAFIVNRIVADQPPAAGTAVTNLPGMLRAAYREGLVQRLGRPWRP